MILITGVFELESEQEFDRLRKHLVSRAERSRKDKQCHSGQRHLTF
jgi:hypothetical protein